MDSRNSERLSAFEVHSAKTATSKTLSGLDRFFALGYITARSESQVGRNSRQLAVPITHLLNRNLRRIASLLVFPQHRVAKQPTCLLHGNCCIRTWMQREAIISHNLLTHPNRLRQADRPNACAPVTPSSGKKLMLSHRSSMLATFICVVLFTGSPAVFAQYYDPGCSACGSPVAAAPMAQCTPVQPVYTSCYQTVPVTTYKRERQTVEVPYYKTSYEEREYTLYRPVTRRKEVEVPTVSYQNVVEYRTVNRDLGRWITRYQPTQKHAPCQVDPRPGMIGWLNRTGYAFRTAFTPSYTTARQYVPNMVTCRVPVTRQVAVRGTRRVTVAETEMVAERKTERVPVQRLAYRKEEVTVMKPQTAYRRVPIGTSMAYGPGYGSTVAYSPYYGGTATAWGLPIIESDTRTSLAPSPDPLSNTSERRAENRSTFSEDTATDSERTFRRAETPDDSEPFQRSSLQEEPAFPMDSEPAFDGNGAATLPTFGPSTQRTNDKSLLIPVSLKTVADQPQPQKATGSWKASSRRTSVARNGSRTLKTASVTIPDDSTSDKN